MTGDGATEFETLELSSLLCTADRDFLIRNNGDRVEVVALKGMKVGLYFSASWCGPCQRFTPSLVQVYKDIYSRNGDFEIVFVSADEDDASFNEYFLKMPWIAIPFPDLETRDGLEDRFKVDGLPHLVILDENGNVLTDGGVDIIRDYGAKGYPFTLEKIKELKEHEESVRREQTLRSILVNSSRDFVISNDGKQVPISQLEGNTVGLYFSLSSYRPCVDFSHDLVEVYLKLKANKASFEVIMVPLDDDEELFRQGFACMPWVSLPFKDDSCVKLARYFELSTLPTLVIIGPDGKTLHPNVAEAVEVHGVQAYPFTPEKFEELAEMEIRRQEMQTLESVLVSGDRDFVLEKNGGKVAVSDLVGKNILLYFSAQWCPPCRAFLPKLIEAYHKIKGKDEAFEVIFISNDSDETSFNEFFSEMPWLALPFRDIRKDSVNRFFKVHGIPRLVALDPTGKTVSSRARELITSYGAEAYPFTDERLKELEARYEEMTEGWPRKVSHTLHEKHALVLTRRTIYTCDRCEGDGEVWSFYCNDCDFDLHPECALEDGEGIVDDDVNGRKLSKDGWTCDGNLCVQSC